MAQRTAPRRITRRDVSSDDSENSSLRPSEAAPDVGKEDLAFALRSIAETMKTQTDLQKKVVDKWTSNEARSKILSTIRIPPFDGHPNTTVKAYRDWKKDITTLKILNQLTDEELALVLYTSFTGCTKQLVECLEISEIRGTDGLERMWQILDDAF